MAMVTMLFIAEQRVAHQQSLALLTPRDIVEMLKETLPHKLQGKEALVARINQRHARRRSAIEFSLPHAMQSGAILNKIVANVVTPSSYEPEIFWLLTYISSPLRTSDTQWHVWERKRQHIICFLIACRARPT